MAQLSFLENQFLLTDDPTIFAKWMALAVERGQLDTNLMWSLLNQSQHLYHVFMYYSPDLAYHFIKEAMEFYLDRRKGGYWRIRDPKIIPRITGVAQILATYDTHDELNEGATGIIAQCYLQNQQEISLYKIEEWSAIPDAPDAHAHGYQFINLSAHLRPHAWGLARLLESNVTEEMREKVLAALPEDLRSIERLRNMRS